MAENWYKISGSELLELIHDSMKLCALENAGVDNWHDYGNAINTFIEANREFPDDTIYDIARNELELNYYGTSYD